MLNQEQRKQSIGASEIAILFGLNKYKSIIDLWLEKTGRRQPENLDDNTNIRRGRALEPAIIEMCRQEQKKNWYNNDVVFGRDYKNISATPDAIIFHEDRINGLLAVDETLEVKSPSTRNYYQWRDGNAPEMYILQVYQQMLCTEANKGYLVAFLGDELSINEYLPNQEIFEAIKAKVAWFWGFVERDEAPPLTGHENDGEFLASLPVKKNELVVASDNVTETIEQLAMIRASLKRQEEIKTQLENAIKQVIGDYEGIKGDWGKVTFKAQKGRSTVDYKSVLSDLEERVTSHICDHFSEMVTSFDLVKESIKELIKESVEAHTKTSEPMRVFRFDAEFESVNRFLETQSEIKMISGLKKGAK